MRVGQVELRPAICEIVGPGGREEIQPKVMQVLVALAEARGETVTRDDLIRDCWDGRVVGDDSINRIIFKIRRLAQGVGGGSFAVKTIAKVGYRLMESSEAESVRPHATHAGRPKAAAARRVPGVGVKLLLGGALVLGAATVATTLSEGTSPPPSAAGSAFYQATARDLAMRGAAASFESTPQQHAQAIIYFRKAIDQTPDHPTLWGSLAMNHYFYTASLPPERQGPIVVRARQAAIRSLQLNPREGHALAALMAVHPNFGNWTAKEAGFRRALSRMDGGSPAPLYQHARFLASVGRVDQALAAVERAHDAHPLVPWIAIERIHLLAANERLEEAERAASKAAELWPRNEDLWTTRFFLHALNGAPDAALRLAEDRSAWPEAARPSDMALMRRTAAAIASPAAADDNAVMADWARLAREGQAYAEQAIRLAAFWGRDDEALKIAEMLLSDRSPAVAKRFADHDEYALAGERPTAILFVAPSEGLWTHPRFMALMAEAGLVDYWRQVRAPDLCLEQAMREICARYGLRPA